MYLKSSAFQVSNSKMAFVGNTFSVVVPWDFFSELHKPLLIEILIKATLGIVKHYQGTKKL